MTKKNVNTNARQPIKLVAMNPDAGKAPPMAELPLAEIEQKLINALRTMRRDYAACLLSSVLVLAEEYPANPAPNLQLVRA